MDLYIHIYICVCVCVTWHTQTCTYTHTHIYIYIHTQMNSRQSEISRLTGKHISDTAATVEVSCKACFLTLLCGGLSSLWRQRNIPPHPTQTPTGSITSSAYYEQRNFISVPWTLTSHPTPPQPQRAAQHHQRTTGSVTSSAYHER